MQIIEGKLTFNFDFDAIKFDDTAFYRNHFSRITNAIKAVDIFAVNKEIAGRVHSMHHNNVYVAWLGA